ncbi:hypothetical protein M433DRAFT_4543 [Acidomyces richmondensis BFW]|nr:hypothetical protein M433DRAFT_4543 [Acidomyces richmondensis BFW]
MEEGKEKEVEEKQKGEEEKEEEKEEEEEEQQEQEEEEKEEWEMGGGLLRLDIAARFANMSNTAPHIITPAHSQE